MKSIAGEFRRRGKTVMIGGPYASLSPEVVRPHCDILIRGEMEEIAPKIFSDLRSGDWDDEYVGTRPDLRTSPMPRWDLYPNDRAIMGSVQTSRGCPFECEFCDVIQYLGRKQRHKPVDQVIAELDQLYRLGYRSAFIADDNFTVYRAHAKKLLAAMRDWNAERAGGRFRFNTQVSIDAAGDEELLRMCADAGLTHVFIGIETPNEVSLREVKKRQNLKKNLVDEIQRFVDFGISVDCGMIVGFDGDDASIFERQYKFAMASPVPIFSLATLVAPDATPLHARLAAEGRLFDNSSVTTAAPWHSNIVPKQMTREEVVARREVAVQLALPARRVRGAHRQGDRHVRKQARAEAARKQRAGHASRLCGFCDADPKHRAAWSGREDDARQCRENVPAEPGRGALHHGEPVPVRAGPLHVRVRPVLGPDAGRRLRPRAAAAAARKGCRPGLMPIPG